MMVKVGYLMELMLGLAVGLALTRHCYVSNGIILGGAAFDRIASVLFLVGPLLVGPLIVGALGMGIEALRRRSPAPWDSGAGCGPSWAASSSWMPPGR